MNSPNDDLPSNDARSAIGRDNNPRTKLPRWLGTGNAAVNFGIGYAIWALPLVMLLAWVVPPWTNTDETFHMLRAVNVAHGQVIGQRLETNGPGAPPGSGGLSDMAIFEAFAPLASLSWLPHRPNGEVTDDVLKRSEQVRWQRGMVPVWFGTTAQYPPVFYLPDVVGYWAGRAFGAHVDATLRLARALNGLVFVGLVSIAIARARRLRALMLALLMLPMTLALAASANQDAGMIAAMALAVSQIDRIADQRRYANLRELTFIALALAFVAMARPPYAAMLLVLVPIAPGRKGRIALTAATALVAAWCLIVALFVMRPLTAQAHPGSQFAGLIADPLSLLKIVANTIHLFLGDYVWGFIGQLAWNDTPLPGLYRALALVTLALAGFASMSGPGLGRRWVVAGGICVVVGVHALLYLDWTQVGAQQIEGVTGRHFLPLAIAAGLALPSWKRALHGEIALVAPLILMAITTPAVMVLHIVRHFYIH